MPNLTRLVAACVLSLAACTKPESHGSPSVEQRATLAGLCGNGSEESTEIESARPNEWFVLAGSFVHTYDTDLCQEWVRLTEAGFAPKLAWSDALPSFRPGWIVLVAGPVRPDSARALAASMQTAVPDAHAWPGW